jgi:plastocyanin
MGIGVRIGIAVLAGVFSILTASTGIEDFFAFGAPVPPHTREFMAGLEAQATTQTSSQAAAPAGNVVEVKIDNFSFSPQTITIKPGTTIVWTNRDDIPHTVVSDDKVFKSKVLDTDEKFSFTFDKAGNFPYFCSVHPKMTGKVIVQ